jgi:hypothetical protein
MVEQVLYVLQKKAKQAPIEPRFAEALQLAWAASRGRSLFAAKCLVSTALELHALGATANDVQSYLAVAGDFSDCMHYLYMPSLPASTDEDTITSTFVETRTTSQK